MTRREHDMGPGPYYGHGTNLNKSRGNRPCGVLLAAIGGLVYWYELNIYNSNKEHT